MEHNSYILLKEFRQDVQGTVAANGPMHCIDTEKKTPA
jgi:hypothetical protein